MECSREVVRSRSLSSHIILTGEGGREERRRE